MDNTIDALRNLYVALGGTASNVADLTIIPDLINAIATLITNGATAELPKVTSSDNGKVLTVVSGKWAKANLPS
jgi:dTDP-D-glucose 4,6-dehydratase